MYVFDADTELQFQQEADDWTFAIHLTLAKTGLPSDGRLRSVHSAHHAFLYSLASSAGAAARRVRQQRRPNILFMFTDDQPQNCLGVMGNDHIQTPHLDQLARRGTLFNNAFATTAICCSNRACILTGQQIYRHGINDFKTPLSAAAFDQTYPALLRQAGYRTGYLGKFAIGSPSGDSRELQTFYRTVDSYERFAMR